LKVTDPNILITEDLLDSSAAIRQVEDQIIEYVQYLSNARKLGSSAVNVSSSAIFNFYSINRINLNKKYVTKFTPAARKLHKDIS